MIWSQIIRGRYQSSFQFSDKDVQARLDAKKPDDANAVGYDYTLRPILFVVPRGSPPAAFEARAKEAEALRARFQSCEEGIALARGMRFVAVRPQVVKSSADLPAAVARRAGQDRARPADAARGDGAGRRSLCAVRQSSQSENTPAKKEVRDQMSTRRSRRVQEISQGTAQQAMIEYR